MSILQEKQSDEKENELNLNFINSLKFRCNERNLEFKI